MVIDAVVLQRGAARQRGGADVALEQHQVLVRARGEGVRRRDRGARSRGVGITGSDDVCRRSRAEHGG